MCRVRCWCSVDYPVPRQRGKLSSLLLKFVKFALLAGLWVEKCATPFSEIMMRVKLVAFVALWSRMSSLFDNRPYYRCGPCTGHCHVFFFLISSPHLYEFALPWSWAHSYNPFPTPINGRHVDTLPKIRTKSELKSVYTQHYNGYGYILLLCVLSLSIFSVRPAMEFSTLFEIMEIQHTSIYSMDEKLNCRKFSTEILAVCIE